MGARVIEQNSALRHHAFVYDTEEEYLAVAVAFLEEGLSGGEGAVVANTRPGIAAVRDALGPRATDVRFVDVSRAYTRPVKTLAAYHEVYADELTRAGSLRAVADVQFGPDPNEWELWIGYEAVFNRSFAHLPAWVLCSYKTAGLPDPVRDGLWRTHPEVVATGAWNHSPSYDRANQPLRPIGRPQALTDPQPIPAGDDLEAVREHLAHNLVVCGLPAAKVLDLLLAATEVLGNALRHGNGVKAVRVGRVRGRYACEVVDNGAGFDDPTAGYLAPRAGRGAGLWVARQLAWEIEFFRSAEGFTARITA